MANTTVDTGHGASITFSSSSYAFNWTSIKPPKQSTPPVDTHHLGSTHMTKIPGDLLDFETVTVEFQFDSSASIPSPGSAAETITITWPQHSTQSTSAATLAGTGFVTGVDIAALNTNELQTGTLEIRFDCETGPTFTAGT